MYGIFFFKGARHQSAQYCRIVPVTDDHEENLIISLKLLWSCCDWQRESIRGSLYLWEPGMRALSDNSLARGTIATLSASRLLSSVLIFNASFFSLYSSSKRIQCERPCPLQSWSRDWSSWKAWHKACITGLNNWGEGALDGLLLSQIKPRDQGQADSLWLPS